MSKEVILSDIDPFLRQYIVCKKNGREIGSKSQTLGYLKPEYGKHGRRLYGKWASTEERKYKSTPPWLKYPVTEIRPGSLCIVIVVADP